MAKKSLDDVKGFFYFLKVKNFLFAMDKRINEIPVNPFNSQSFWLSHVNPLAEGDLLYPT